MGICIVMSVLGKVTLSLFFCPIFLVRENIDE